MFDVSSSFGRALSFTDPHAHVVDRMQNQGHNEKTIKLFLKALDAESDHDIKPAFEYLKKGVLKKPAIALAEGKASGGEGKSENGPFMADCRDILRCCCHESDEDDFDALFLECDLHDTGIMEFIHFKRFIQRVSCSQEIAFAVERKESPTHLLIHPNLRGGNFLGWPPHLTLSLPSRKDASGCRAKCRGSEIFSKFH